MTVDPEELFDRLATGELTESERSLLVEHARSCPVSALELNLRQDEGIEVTEKDVAVVDRYLDSLDGAPPKGRWIAVAAAVALVFVVGSTGAYAAVSLGWIELGESAESPTGTSTESDSGGHPPEDLAAGEPSAEEAQAEETLVVEPESEDEEVGEPERPRIQVAPTVEETTAEQLYSSANSARRRGEHRRALALYQQLSREHPGSRQAVSSQVSAGSLALRQLSNPRLALRYFDRYLASGGSGALALEARVGRALSLGRLGRRAEERQAWEAVLRHHPNSVHAERARARLDEL